MLVAPESTQAPQPMLKPVPVADPKDIDWDGRWKSYGELFDGNAAEV